MVRGEISAYSGRSRPWWRTPWALLPLVALPLLLWVWPRGGVRLEVNPGLSPEGACGLGFSEVPRLPQGKIEVGAEWLPGGMLHVVHRTHRGDVDETDVWLWLEPGGVAKARAAFRTTRRGPGGYVAEASGVHGRVVLQRPLDEDLRARRLLAPLTLVLDLRGLQWEIEERCRWKIHLPAGAGTGRPR